MNKPAGETKKNSCAEFGTGAFAFLNVVAVSICLVGWLCFMAMLIIEFYIIGNNKNTDPVVLCLCIGVSLGIMMVFGFAVLLFLGMYQRKPSFVLAYFVFGVITVFIVVAGIVALYYENLDDNMTKELREIFFFYYEPVINTLIGICVVYTLLLTMVCRTWFLMRSRSHSHEKLVNYYDESDWRIE